MAQPRRPGRHEEGARTRERVLDAASALIAANGYAATSISRISQRAGVNPASIYWAFESKEGLLVAVMERAADDFFEQLARKPGMDVWAALTSLADDFAGGPEFLRLLLVLSLERRDGDPRVLDAARRVRRQAVEGLAAGFESVIELENRFQRIAICEQLARFTLMLMDGVFVASQIESDSLDLGRAFQTLSLGVRATAERLVADAREVSSPVSESQESPNVE